MKQENDYKGIRILVCGGRNFTRKNLLFQTLDKIDSACCIDRVIHGGADGADKLAHKWALTRSVPVSIFQPRWDLYGRRAGRVRNEKMLTEGKPDLVVAFPGGKGTAHMVRISKEDGFEVEKIV